MIIQIYEIQTPDEVEKVADLGVTTLGSVILSQEDWRVTRIRETVRLVQAAGLKSSLIPLFADETAVFRVLDYYAPDIVHFCDVLDVKTGSRKALDMLRRLQESVKDRHPELEVMRSLPVGRPGWGDVDGLLALAAVFEPVSDYFLIDTVLAGAGQDAADSEPVAGFVGITGLTCDWAAAGRLVAVAGIPVILAGGISPANVYEAVVRVRPAGVDSCTGTNAVDVNGSPVRFRKDRLKVEKLVKEARRAQRDIHPAGTRATLGGR